jgi:competence protein ComEC
VTARAIGPGLVLGAVLVGVLAGEAAGPSPARLGAGGAVVAFTAALACAWTRRGIAGLALCCVAAALAGGAVMSRALDGQLHSPLAAVVAGRESATIDVTLAADPDATRFAARVVARVGRVHRETGASGGGGRMVVIDASGDAAPRLAVLAAGDQVRLRGYFRPLDRFEARERWRHAVGAFSADDLVAFSPPASPLLRLANALRSRVLAGHRQVPEPQRALLAGFLLGDTSDLPDVVVAEFRAAGLSHLVAVSGQNVAFVLALVGPLVRRGPRGARLVGGLAVLTVFAAMTRWEPSVLRASAMAACSMVALAAGRPTAGLRALALAVTGLLLVDPFLVHSVGFVLSCAASVGIAVLGPPIATRVPGPRALADAVGVTVGAQLAVAPVLIAVFDGVPLVAVPANLLVAPFAGPLTVLGLVGGLTGGVVDGIVGGGGAGVVGAVVSFPAVLCATVVLTVARVAARTPVVLGAPQLVVLGSVAVAVRSAIAAKRPARWSRGGTTASSTSPST